jgi:hypothetical protein
LQDEARATRRVAIEVALFRLRSQHSVP